MRRALATPRRAVLVAVAMYVALAVSRGFPDVASTEALAGAAPDAGVTVVVR